MKVYTNQNKFPNQIYKLFNIDNTVIAKSAKVLVLYSSLTWLARRDIGGLRIKLGELVCQKRLVLHKTNYSAESS